MFDSGAQHTMINQKFVNKYKIPTKHTNFKYAQLANGNKVLLNGETEAFTVDLQGVSTSIKGLVMHNLNYDIVAGMDWLTG